MFLSIPFKILLGCNIRNKNQSGIFFILDNSKVVLGENKYVNKNGICAIVRISQNEYSYLEKRLFKFQSFIFERIDHYETILKEDIERGLPLDTFWKKMGYNETDTEPSNDIEFIKTRNIRFKQLKQCDECKKWRLFIRPYEPEILNCKNMSSKCDQQERIESNIKNVRFVSKIEREKIDEANRKRKLELIQNKDKIEAARRKKFKENDELRRKICNLK